MGELIENGWTGLNVKNRELAIQLAGGRFQLVHLMAAEQALRQRLEQLGREPRADLSRQ